jgi:hypothetical protein
MGPWSLFGCSRLSPYRVTLRETIRFAGIFERARQDLNLRPFAPEARLQAVSGATKVLEIRMNPSSTVDVEIRLNCGEIGGVQHPERPQGAIQSGPQRTRGGEPRSRRVR